MKDAERAAQLYGDGRTVAYVARMLGISHFKAKKLKPEASAKPAAEQETADERWELGIKVPLERAEEIWIRATDNEKLAAFRQLEDQDKMDCVLTILQLRMDELLVAPPVPFFGPLTLPVPDVKEGQ